MDWQLRPARDLTLSTWQRWRSHSRESGLTSLVLHRVWLLAVDAYLRLAHRLRVTGREHLPDAPFVMVANHGSHLDALVLAAALPKHLARRARTLAAGDVFFDSLPVSGFAALAINALPIWRARTSTEDLALLRRRLTEDAAVLIMFPEGTRSRTGEMARFRAGLGALVAGTAVPVVPCRLHGAHAAWPPGRRLPRPSRVTLTIGAPLSFADVEDTRDGWVAVADASARAVRAERPEDILVIRLGALGDFTLSFGPFAAIRAHHPHANVTLLTTAPFAELARASPWFDRVEVDARPPWWDLAGMARLRRQLRGFDRVYDLQTSRRSATYARLAGRAEWSGIGRVSHPHANPARDGMHTLERQRDQLRMAGIPAVPWPDLAWLAASPAPKLPGRFALLVPGAAPHRPAKRWPAGRFGELAVRLAAQGLTPVVVGVAAEAALAAIIRTICPTTIDLTGRTSLAEMAALSARAALAVGNDTGPMHLAAAMGCPTLTLFSAESDPALTAPRGPGGSWPATLRVEVLADLTVDRVAARLPPAR